MDNCRFSETKIREIVRSELRFLVLELRGQETDRRLTELLSSLDREKEERERKEIREGKTNGK